MPEEYTNLVKALKELSQGTSPDPVITLPMAENEWNTRPDTESYGIVSLDFEADALYGDDLKQCISYAGSVQLYSHRKDGAGWLQLITDTLTAYCDGCWSFNSLQWERENNLFHWEWVFEVEG